MSPPKLRRRDALIGLGGSLVAIGMAQGGRAMAGEGEGKGLKVATGLHPAVPLPFDPKKLRGLSERLLVSHHDNNYGGALKNLNRVETELAQTNKDTPGFVVAGLRDKELTFTNSVVLHELYFGNLGGDGRPAGEVAAAIAASFGSQSRFQELLSASAMGLAGGSGWVVLDFNFHSGDLRLNASGSHSQAMAFGAPLLVLDMYEHSYQLDFGAAASKYLEAFDANLDWAAIDRRYQAAKRAHQQLRG